VAELHRYGKLRVLRRDDVPARIIAAPVSFRRSRNGLPRMTATGSIGLLAPAGTSIGYHRTRSRQESATAVALEPAYKQMLIDEGIEPTSTTTQTKFRRTLAGGCCSLGPIVQSAGADEDSRLSTEGYSIKSVSTICGGKRDVSRWVNRPHFGRRGGPSGLPRSNRILGVRRHVSKGHGTHQP